MKCTKSKYRPLLFCGLTHFEENQFKSINAVKGLTVGDLPMGHSVRGLHSTFLSEDKGASLRSSFLDSVERGDPARRPLPSGASIFDPSGQGGRLPGSWAAASVWGHGVPAA